jgi:hypothetical protein
LLLFRYIGKLLNDLHTELDKGFPRRTKGGSWCPNRRCEIQEPCVLLFRYIGKLLNDLHTELDKEFAEEEEAGRLVSERDARDFKKNIWMVDEALLILQRTEDPSSVPYKHT